MARRTSRFPPTWNIADLIEYLGHIPPQRIRFHPFPGTATEKDVIEINAHEDRLYELVDGVLVEKAMGFRESFLAVEISHALVSFVKQNDLGIVVGADGTIRLAPRLVRIPDVAFFSWQRLPGKVVPAEPIPDLAPDLAIEVLSESNTAAEMERKLKDYFFAGVRLVWLVDPEKRVADVYTAPDQRSRLKEGQALDGNGVLPGFALPLTGLFALVPRPANGGKKKGPRGKNGKKPNGR
jgi:Uma2 family endonuclease